MKKRIIWVDIAKYICIMLVLINHWEGCPEEFTNFFNPFFLTCFFFLSGYCYNKKTNFKDFITSKIKTLFIPWFIFSYANIFLSRIISFKQHKSLITELVRNAYQIRGYDDKLWFLSCLFIAFIPFYFLIEYYEKKKDKRIIIPVTIVAFVTTYIKFLLKHNNFTYPWGNTNLPWHLEYVYEVVLFMFLGYMFKTKYESKVKVSNTTIFLSITLYLLSLYVLDFANANVFGSVIIYYIREIFGVLMIVLISKSLKINKYISFIGSNTLVCFCIQNKMSTLMEEVISRSIPIFYNHILNNVYYSIVFSLLFAFVESLLLIVPIMIINKYLYFILGKRRNIND